MVHPDRSNRSAWVDAAYDTAWRILHDRDAAVAAASQGLKIDESADLASEILVMTRRRALELLEDRDGVRPQIEDEVAGVAFVTDTDAGSSVPSAEDAWGAAEAMGPADASLVDLHLRFAVPADRLAQELDSTEAPSELLRRLRGRLEGALASWRLWNDGRPRCDELADELLEAGVQRFRPTTGRRIAKHAVGCTTCRRTMSADHATSIDVFVSAPVLMAPSAVRDAIPSESRPVSASVFVDAEPASAPSPAPADSGDETVQLPIADPAVSQRERPSVKEPAPVVSAGGDPGDDRVPENDFDDGPGALAGILVGLIAAIILIAGVTAWAITSS